MKIHQTITENSWCQNSMCVSTTGDDLVRVADPKAAKWCAFGWLLKSYPDKKLHTAMTKVYDHLKSGIIEWNDSQQRTFKEVKALFKRCNL